jgi:hypothetical protein
MGANVELKSEKKSVRDLLDLKKNSMLTVNPEYQRAAVWNEAQQKRLIDSVLRGYPLPLIYLHYRKKVVADMQREDLEIIDGQQRINALYRFSENVFKLFDPVQDDKQARFPIFIKNMDCPWARRDFLSLSPELKERFLDTELFIVKVTTSIDDEARDLFIRLQAGLPLNAQEKRDAWPGGFTELILKLGGKKEITRYPGHDFFKSLVQTKSSDRGEVRQLCAQICMLFLEKATQDRWVDIGTQPLDDYYYRNLGFDVNSSEVTRLTKVLDLAVQLFSQKAAPKLKGHEAIHIVLLLDSLLDDYTKSWQPNFIKAYDAFKLKAAEHKKARKGEYWYEYGALTQTQSAEGKTIQKRHAFFVTKMFDVLQPILLDTTRAFGTVEREIVYYSNEKKCGECGEIIPWEDLEIHHVDEYQYGGGTTLDNAAPVHKAHHPKGQAAVEQFKRKWEDHLTERRQNAEHKNLSISEQLLKELEIKN